MGPTAIPLTPPKHPQPLCGHTLKAVRGLCAAERPHLTVPLGVVFRGACAGVAGLVVDSASAALSAPGAATIAVPGSTRPAAMSDSRGQLPRESGAHF